MGSTQQKIARWVIQAVFYLFFFSILLGRAVSAGISHDENQFIAAGQMLAYHGLLPYRDYAYTHMPYAVALYALSAAVSPYDFLAARVLGILTWLACIPVMAAIVRVIARGTLAATERAAWIMLLGETTLGLILLYDPDSTYVLAAALNHSFATLFALLSVYFTARGLERLMPLRRAAFWSGCCITAAGLTRFNFAAVALLLFLLWGVMLLVRERASLRSCLMAFTGGAGLAALPAMILLLIAPAGFYYANAIYVQLNTLYYEGILFRQTMDLPSKIIAFGSGLFEAPINLFLYAITLFGGVLFIVQFVKHKRNADFIGLTTAGFAAGLFLSALAPTPTQAHYFFGPLPFMLLAAALLGLQLYRGLPHLYVLVAVGLWFVLILTHDVQSPVQQWSALSKPEGWRPIQVHDWSVSLHRLVPNGRVLSLLPMLTMETGYDAYSFTTTGAFVWRTSLLLSAGRRAVYGVISPQELASALDPAPPAAILTGFETANAGFTFGQLGGLEVPFSDYARRHGYAPISLSPPFLGHAITLWVKQR